MKRRILAAAVCAAVLTATLTGCDIPVDEATSALGALASAASDVAENANVGDTLTSAAEAADINDDTTSAISGLGEKADEAISGILDFTQGVIDGLQEGTESTDTSGGTESEPKAETSGEASSEASSEVDTSKPADDATSTDNTQVVQDVITGAAEALNEIGNTLSGVMDGFLSDASSTDTSTGNS